jgi:hypothetical protein
MNTGGKTGKNDEYSWAVHGTSLLENKEMK